MGAFLVVDGDPLASNFPNLPERLEHVSIQDLMPESTVKAFDVGILIRLTRLDLVELHALSPGTRRSTPVTNILGHCRRGSRPVCLATARGGPACALRARLGMEVLMTIAKRLRAHPRRGCSTCESGDP